LFNITTNLLENNKNGMDGLYIPVTSEGLLKVSITLMDNKNNIRYVNINKDIKFLGDDNNERHISKKDKDFSVDDSFIKEKYYD
jgi:hypothetical protein